MIVLPYMLQLTDNYVFGIWESFSLFILAFFFFFKREEKIRVGSDPIATRWLEPSHLSQLLLAVAATLIDNEPSAPQ